MDLASQVVVVQNVLRWLFVSLMTPGTLNHLLAPSWSSGVPSSTSVYRSLVPARLPPVLTAARATICPLGP